MKQKYPQEYIEAITSVNESGDRYQYGFILFIIKKAPYRLIECLLSLSQLDAPASNSLCKLSIIDKIDLFETGFRLSETEDHRFLRRLFQSVYTFLFFKEDDTNV